LSPHALSVFIFSRKFYLLSIYFGVCLIISQPVIFGIYNLLYTPTGFPAGVDVAVHTFLILKIIETKNPLIQWTGFPEIKGSYSGIGYYPSLFHIIIGGLTFVTTVGNVSLSSAINTIKAFMFTTYILGILGYALLLKTIIDRVIYDPLQIINHNLSDPKYIVTYCVLLVLAFGLFIYSTAPLIKTFNDGNYAEIFAVWCIFPIYFYFLLQKRWIVSGVLLAVIASTHTISLVMALVPTISYFVISSLLSKASLKKSWVFIISFILLSLPAITFFYLPIAIAAINGSIPGVGFPFSLKDIVFQLTDYLFYAGIIASILVLFINYKLLSWLSGWGIAYLSIALSSNIYSVRFGRELSIAFGLTLGICITLILYKIIIERPAFYRQSVKYFKNLFHDYSIYVEKKYWTDKKQMISAVLITLVILSTSYGYFADRIKNESNPNVLAFDSPVLVESNKYFLGIPANHLANMTENNVGNERTDRKPTVLVFGINPWLKPMLYGKFSVLATTSEGDAKYLGEGDRNINIRLLTILNGANSREAMITIKEYNIDYIYVSDFLPNRYYSESDLSEKSKLESFQIDSHSNYINLEKQFIGDGGLQFRIYSINHKALQCMLNTALC
jgi:hypothetical protein